MNNFKTSRLLTRSCTALAAIVRSFARTPALPGKARRCASYTMLACCALLMAQAARAAGEPSAPMAESAASPLYQITNVTQAHNHFRSPYAGTNSLSANGRTEETTDITLFLGHKLGSNTEIWVNPEIDQGFGFNDTTGLAGFPNGAAYKLGQNRPYFRLHRAFIRHTLDLGGEPMQVPAGTNQLQLNTTSDNLVFTAGKFAAVDVFDTNRYAHDPRADFLNWSIVDAGAFDYAADSWGYTFGASAEWNHGAWALRSGIFQLSAIPNGKVTGFHPHQNMLAFEAERRHMLAGMPGKLKVLAFVLRARMGRYDEAVALASQGTDAPDTMLVRRFQSRNGIVLNLEQEVAPSVGVFARASANDGRKESYEFTEINRSVAAGVSVRGAKWGRTNDSVGLAGVVNGLAAPARRYFAAGGTGILIGDGALTYGSERIVEAYYSARLASALTATLDFQRVVNPAYNRDRGPVNILGLRMHFEY